MRNDDVGNFSVLDHLHESKEVLAPIVEAAPNVFQVLGHFLVGRDLELVNASALAGKVES